MTYHSSICRQPIDNQCRTLLKHIRHRPPGISAKHILHRPAPRPPQKCNTSKAQAYTPPSVPPGPSAWDQCKTYTPPSCTLSPTKVQNQHTHTHHWLHHRLQRCSVLQLYHEIIDALSSGSRVIGLVARYLGVGRHVAKADPNVEHL